MRRLLYLLARLYPPEWRTRYGDEFAALLDDARPRWRDVFDVLKGGLGMRLQNASVARTALVFGAFGALLAFGVALAIRDQYVSTAVLRVTAPAESANQGVQSYSSASHAAVDVVLSQSVQSLAQGVLTRPTLLSVIDMYGLYPVERGNLPREELLHRMSRSIHISPVVALRSTRRSGPGLLAFQVTFLYPDRYVAQQVTHDLTNRFVQATAGREFRVETLDAANLPEGPVYPARYNIALAGLLGGALLGICAGFLLRVRRRQMLQSA